MRKDAQVHVRRSDCGEVQHRYGASVQAPDALTHEIAQLLRAADLRKR